MSDISDMIKTRVTRELPYSREYEASLSVTAIGQVDTNLDADAYSAVFNIMTRRLKSIILNTVYQNVIDKLEALSKEHVIESSQTGVYPEYLIHCKIVDDLQKLIRELRGL